MIEERSRDVFFFFSFFFNKARNFLEFREDRRENACKRERRQEGSKKHAPFLPTTPTYHRIRVPLGLLLLLWMRIFNIFPSRLFIYLFIFYLDFHITLDLFFFFFLSRLDNSRV